MIGGIFETVGKTLGIGKEKYFLELDDTAEASVKTLKKSAKAAAETAKEASADVVEKTQAIVDDAKEAASKTVEEAADKAQEVVKGAAQDTAESVESAAAKTKAVAKKSAGKAAKTPQNVAAKAAPSAPTEEELIVNAIAAASSGKTIDNQGNIVEGPTNFSTDYLMTPIRTSRRRPGPSLGDFKGMAKEVNPRLRT